LREIIIIVAVAKNNVIGKDNKIPWYIPDDFKHFKELTISHPIIMGKNTYLSLPKRPLVDRENIVLTFEDDAFDEQGITIMYSLKDALVYTEGKDVYIIGGASVYKQAIELATKIEITRIEKEYDGDTFFPEIDNKIWKLIKEDKREGYSFQTYIKES